jgi:hypothetical protein
MDLLCRVPFLILTFYFLGGAKVQVLGPAAERRAVLYKNFLMTFIMIVNSMLTINMVTMGK